MGEFLDLLEVKSTLYMMTFQFHFNANGRNILINTFHKPCIEIARTNLIFHAFAYIRMWAQQKRTILPASERGEEEKL